jgi:L-cysteate sulfo-lyase
MSSDQPTECDPSFSPPLPRVHLAHLPTPLEEMPRLSAALAGPRIWIKRDDLTGLAFGGSKVRALELTLADALRQGADTIVTMGEPQSNHVRLTAAAARKLGLEAVLVIAAPAEPSHLEGNLLLSRLLGAQVRFAPWSEHGRTVERTVQELKDRGRVPYVLPFGGSLPIGTIAYIHGALELHTQAKDLGLTIDHVLHATASGGLQIGLTIGNRMLAARTKVTGVGTAWNTRQTLLSKCSPLVSEIRRVWNAAATLDPQDLSLVDFHSAEGRDAEGEETRIRDAIALVARTEGILLDPEYTGKAMAVLIDMVRHGRFDRTDTVVFLHTGGTPALFVQSPARLAARPFGFLQVLRSQGKKYRALRWCRDTLRRRGKSQGGREH